MLPKQELLLRLGKIEAEIKRFLEGLKVVAGLAESGIQLLLDCILLLGLIRQLLYMNVGFFELTGLLF